ncbi:peptidoglycan-binding domain-containing protein [Aneurinibacillus tyrosinisolvens]|uniref:peptidoglycan-binding domain-containing protein n=1 Tax=Aneurinibacillus tyrosinisolvens TaxID=1443435 RepID=UPI0006994A6D|nr:peptidoglycan-binding domain-containing protein [Aneurinibacillus tyrosinisolvens]
MVNGTSVLIQDGKAISANKGTRHLGAAIVFKEKAVSPILRKGDRGEAVKQLQENLAAAGFSPGAIDGIFGNATENAVKQFQQDHQLVADGIVGQKTWSAL